MTYPITYIPSYNIRYHEPFEEEFVYITDRSVPGIMPWYLISNFGRVFHRHLNDFLAINIDSKGYSYKPLVISQGKQINVRIHRIVLMEFAYIPGCENLLVNHKDGNKANNLITNLEWCTFSENMQHAYDILNIGRVHSCKYSDELLLHAICKDLQDGVLTIKEIGDKYNVPDDLVSSILYGKAHKEISKNYIFKPRKSKMTNDDVNKICQIFSSIDNPDKPSISNELCRYVLTTIGYDYNEITYSNIEIVRRIYLRRCFKDISNNYNW